ncbi:MAG: flavodoxin [Clostridia bacterium]|nr:flavodoxin [Clostridia bacterium]
MKKLFAVVLALCLMGGAAMAESSPRILIAYVSRAGENYNVGTADPDSASASCAGYTEKGNTQIVAETIAEMTGGDLYQITTVEPYPDDYASMLTRAQEELDADARPELAGELPNLDDYDIIMIGYPIWHGATPRPVLTFLESYDLSGKKLVPFNTHEGSGQSGTVSEIEASAPGAEMLEGIAIQGKVAQEDASRTRELLTEWLGKQVRMIL